MSAFRKYAFRVAIVLWLLPLIISGSLFLGSGGNREYLGGFVLHDGPTPQFMADDRALLPWLVIAAFNGLTLLALRASAKKDYKYAPAILGSIVLWYVLSVLNFFSHLCIA